MAEGIEEVNIIVSADSTEELTRNRLDDAVSSWRPNWDTEWGGNKGDQKFMLPVNLNFLLDYGEITNDLQVRGYVKTTLDKMMAGGIYDHVGGGFYRYSTDRYWKIPHFEKMLYDNAQLISLYAKAYTIFKDERYKKVVEETVLFLDREMENEEGGYYAALDADSEGEEGKFYVWKKEELESVLNEDYIMFQEFYGIHPNEVWENGNYVIHETQGRREFAKDKDLSEAELNVLVSKWQKLLLTARNERTMPRKDDKVITSWNALLVSGFVEVYKAFGNEAYLDRAITAFNLISKNNGDEGGLVHSFKKGSKAQPGFLEDYAFLASAALDLYQVTLDSKYLDTAIELNGKIQNDFSDADSGLFVYNAKNELISKILKIDDGVLPSPNAVAAHNLFQLGHIVYDVEMLKKSKNMLSAIAPFIEESPYSYAKWNSLWLNSAYPFYEIAVVGKNAERLVADLNARYLPNSLIVGSRKASKLPLFESRYFDNDTFIYVCQQTTCKLPVRTVQEAVNQFDTFTLSPFQ